MRLLLTIALACALLPVAAQPVSLSLTPPALSSVQAAPPQTGTRSVTLGWGRSTDPNVNAYRIYFGTNSALASGAATVGNVTNVTIGSLLEWSTYYFSAVAIATNGMESLPSNQLSVFINPVVTITPIAFAARVVGRPGSTNVWSVSTNLTTWTKVQTNIGTGAIIQLIRTNNGTREFIRVQ